MLLWFKKKWGFAARTELFDHTLAQRMGAIVPLSRFHPASPFTELLRGDVGGGL